MVVTDEIEQSDVEISVESIKVYGVDSSCPFYMHPSDNPNAMLV